MKKIILTSVLTAILTLLPVSVLAQEATVVYPTGNPAVDPLNVQSAVDLGGTVVLKAYDEMRNPQAFEFGEFDPTIPGSGGMVVITKGVIVTGETRNDAMTTIRNGWPAFFVGWDVPPDGPVTIKGIHFEDPGDAAVVVHHLVDRIVIKDNKVTDNMYDVFGGTEKPDPLTPEWFLAWTKMVEAPDFPAPGLSEWMRFGVTVGPSLDPSVPPGEVTGSVVMKNNYVNFEEGLLPGVHTPVWWHTFGLFVTSGDIDTKLVGNTVRNCTARGIMSLDNIGKVMIKDNTVEAGPLGSYHTGIPVAAFGISSYYGFFGLPGMPDVGGPVRIIGNRVSCGSAEKIGIAVGGFGGMMSGQALVADNHVTIADGLAGMTLSDVEGCRVVDNRVEGTGWSAVYVGTALDDPFQPLPTTYNLIRDIDSSDFLSFSDFDIVLETDTEQNRVIDCTGPVLDLGINNRVR